ncbi:hypothetical protein TNCV_847941 [Trichonephila clavipes]|uniref:Uncharacterized protein n=1 Tax=Trichonephila clavipes TaxID=2585209 RepID=A0A8X6V106_TRICX|nr:hypothetical protein TNCV_847941 [Trichonephila clavipes]
MADVFEIQHDSHLLVYADGIFLYNSGANWNKTIGEMQEYLNKNLVWCKNGNCPPLQKKLSNQLSRKRSTIPPLLKICDKSIPEVKGLKKSWVSSSTPISPGKIILITYVRKDSNI